MMEKTFLRGLRFKCFGCQMEMSYELRIHHKCENKELALLQSETHRYLRIRKEQIEKGQRNGDNVKEKIANFLRSLENLKAKHQGANGPVSVGLQQIQDRIQAIKDLANDNLVLPQM